MINVYAFHEKMESQLKKARERVNSEPLEALRLAKEVGLEARSKSLATLEGRALHIQTMACRTLGQTEEAFRYVKDALVIFESFGDAGMLAELYRWLGVLHFYSGRYGKALANFKQGRSFAYKIENYEEVVRAQNCIGEVYRKAGDFDKALESYKEGIDLGERYQVVQGIGHILSNTAEVYTVLGKYTDALEKYEAAKAYFETTDDVLLKFEWYFRMGKLNMQLGDYVKALYMADCSIAQFKSVSNQYYILDALLLKYEILMRQDRSDEALQIVEQAEAISKSGGSDHQLSRIYEKMYQFYESNEMYKKALEYHKRYQFTLQKIDAANILIKLEMLEKQQAAFDEEIRAHSVRDFIETEMESEKLRIESLKDSMRAAETIGSMN